MSKTIGSIAVELKVKGIGGNCLGRWLLVRVAQVFNIALDVVSLEKPEVKERNWIKGLKASWKAVSNIATIYLIAYIAGFGFIAGVMLFLRIAEK